jgi:cobalamin biosynthesis Co2+ chelatase CbiK
MNSIQLASNDLLQKVCEEFPKIFKSEIYKDPTYHFGFKQWDDIQIEILEHVKEAKRLNKETVVYEEIV